MKSVSTIRRDAIKNGTWKFREPVDRDRCVRLWNDGLTANEIAKEVGRSDVMIRLILKEAGVFVKHRNAKGVRVNTNGYMEYTRGPNCGRNVHTVIMEEMIGRKLKKSEVVHHIDEDRLNNDIDNLALMTRSAHTRLHRMLDIEKNILRERDERGRFT
jgi:hypothetical protein